MTYVLLALALVAAVVGFGCWLWHPTSITRGNYLRPGQRVEERRYQDLWARRPWRKIPERAKRPCYWCGELTDGRRGSIDPLTLRRRYRLTCLTCTLADIGNGTQADCARRRTEDDWSRPIPDQYPGMTRTLIRDFITSGADDLVLADAHPSQVSTINYSLGTLGFGDECYAEQRSNTVVIRRSYNVRAAS